MTLSGMALVIPACMVMGIATRYLRDLAVLRCLKRLLEGCDQGQRVEICRVLAASLHAASLHAASLHAASLHTASRPEPPGGQPPSEPVGE
ncbi:hypothetical protein GXW82_23915 [Streptacidiphilus sp. 4-A2]|nr:hypothetical protein [Streptacidiphilus sp. 4-A2]